MSATGGNLFAITRLRVLFDFHMAVDIGTGRRRKVPPVVAAVVVISCVLLTFFYRT